MVLPFYRAINIYLDQRRLLHYGRMSTGMEVFWLHTGCLIKNASTHNFFIYYPISMNKKTEDMVFYALRSNHKIIFFLRYFQ
jgi:hypothetical protein